MVFHYLEVLDALKLTQFDLVGSCVGGWIAAELAVRHPEKIRKLVLIGAAGLFVEGALIGDVFMNGAARVRLELRDFAGNAFLQRRPPDALEMFPDGKGEMEDEVRRYQMLRLSSRIGFKPPYFYNHSLRNRLHRIIVAGAGHLGRKGPLWCRAPTARLMPSEFQIARNLRYYPRRRP